MEKTIDTILDDITTRVKENQPVSPAMWIDAAIKLNALKGDLDNNIACFEADLTVCEANYIEDGKPQSTAKTMAKAFNPEAYRNYLKAKAKAVRIIEFIRLAKHRSKIEEY